MTRAERAAMKRRNQIRRAKRRYRQRLKEKKARQEPTSPLTGPIGQRPAVDPVWAPSPAVRVPEPPQPVAQEPFVHPKPEPEEPVVPKPEPVYVRHAARVKAPKPPKALADAVDPATGRRRVRIPLSDGRVVEGETRGGGGDAMPSATEILDWEN